VSRRSEQEKEVEEEEESLFKADAVNEEDWYRRRGFGKRRSYWPAMNKCRSVGTTRYRVALPEVKFPRSAVLAENVSTIPFLLKYSSPTSTMTPSTVGDGSGTNRASIGRSCDAIICWCALLLSSKLESGILDDKLSRTLHHFDSPTPG